MPPIPESLPLPSFLRAPRRATRDVPMRVDPARRRLSFKLALVGPSECVHGHGAKSRALQLLHRTLPPEGRGDVTSIATEGDRTLFFTAPWGSASVGGLSVQVNVFTVAGCCYFEATRKLASRGASGFVFVPSTALDRLDESVSCLEELEDHLRDEGRDVATVPSAFLWMRRSRGENNVEPEQLAPLFNPGRVRPELFADYEAGGDGIVAAFEAVIAQAREIAAYALP